MCLPPGDTDSFSYSGKTQLLTELVRSFFLTCRTEYLDGERLFAGYCLVFGHVTISRSSSGMYERRRVTGPTLKVRVEHVHTLRRRALATQDIFIRGYGIG